MHLRRTSGILFIGLTLVGLTVAAPNAGVSLGEREPERWTCEIDLHQGDAGRLEIERSESGIQGTMTVQRQSARAPQTSTIKGSWGREVIRFTRTLSPTSEQPFIGIAVGSGGKTMTLAGRFAAGFEGIWSATCSSGAAGATGTGPGTAIDSDVRTTPPAPPTKAPTAGSCAITVAAAGPRADLARIYQVFLRGPDSRTNVRGRQPFGSGRITFSDLPDGRYLLTLDTKADVSVTITPRSHEVVCSGAHVEKVFELR